MTIRLLALILAIALPVFAAGDAPAVPQFAQVPDPARNRVHVALVFDDGPFPEHAPKLVSLFSEQKIHVTFSFVGTNVLAHPETARQVADAGHEIANHSYSHRHARDLDDAELEHEIADTQKIITGAIGKPPRWYWPVFVEIDDRVRAAARQADAAVYVAQHLVVSKDYDLQTGAEEIQRLATSEISDGTTILFHEWRDETLQALPAILAKLRRQGCVFLTFSEMDAYLRGRDKENAEGGMKRK